MRNINYIVPMDNSCPSYNIHNRTNTDNKANYIHLMGKQFNALPHSIKSHLNLNTFNFKTRSTSLCLYIDVKIVHIVAHLVVRLFAVGTLYAGLLSCANAYS